MRRDKNSNFFFPFTSEEEDVLEDGYNGEDDLPAHMVNGWYETMSGIHFIYFEKNSKYREESH